jgi:hypothetical protein
VLLFASLLLAYSVTNSPYRINTPIHSENA